MEAEEKFILSSKSEIDALSNFLKKETISFHQL